MKKNKKSLKNKRFKIKNEKGVKKGHSKYEQKRQNKRKGNYSANSPFILEPENLDKII